MPTVGGAKDRQGALISFLGSERAAASGRPVVPNQSADSILEQCMIV